MHKVMILSIVLAFFGVVYPHALVFQHATVHYPSGYEELAVRIGSIFEDIRDDIVNLFENDPGRVNIFIMPKTTNAEGFSSFQEKMIAISTWHPAGVVYNYLPLDDWYRAILIHEFTHIVTLRDLKGIAKFLADLNMPYTPNFGVFGDASIPFEGPAVFAESMFSENSGRLLSPLTDAFLGSIYVASGMAPGGFGTLPRDGIADNFRMHEISYRGYGDFFEYLVEKYGIEKVKEYLKDSMSNSYHWGYTFINLLFPLAASLDFSWMLFFTPASSFEKHFNNSLADELMEWLESIDVEFKGEIVYEGENERIHKIMKERDLLYILKSKFGPVSGYMGTPINELIVTRGGFVEKRYFLAANDVKVENGKIYALVKTGDLMEIWEVESSRKLVSGFISAFDVFNGKLIYSVYDDRKDESIIHGLGEERRVKGFVRNLAFDGESLYYLVGNTLYRDDEVVDNIRLKGAFLGKENGKVYLCMKVGRYMELVDVKNFEKVSDGIYAFDAIEDGDTLYYVSYTRKGMAVYKTGVTRKKIDRKVKEREQVDVYAYRNASFLEEMSYHLTPVAFAPFMLTTYSMIIFIPGALEMMNLREGWGVGSILEFKPALKSHLVLLPFYSRYVTYYDETYTLYGSGYGLISLYDNFKVLAGGIVESREPYVWGAGWLEWKPLSLRLRHDTTLKFSVSLKGIYKYDSSGFSSDYWELTPNISLTRDTLSFNVNYIMNGSTSEESTHTVGFDVLTVFDEHAYSYLDLKYCFNNSTWKYYGVICFNIFPYSQSGWTIGLQGKGLESQEFLTYIYMGFLDLNNVYMMSGIKFKVDGTQSYFYGIGTKPHKMDLFMYTEDYFF